MRSSTTTFEVARKNANKPEAMETHPAHPHADSDFLAATRDHQQGIFKLTYEWMKEAGKDVQWASFNHPVHGYVFIMNQSTDHISRMRSSRRPFRSSWIISTST